MLSPVESRAWGDLYQEKLHQVMKRGGPFGQLVDLRGFRAANAAVWSEIKKAMRLFRDSGGYRSATILDNPIDAAEVRRLARESGADTWQRYLDAESEPDSEKVALAWIINGKDPNSL